MTSAPGGGLTQLRPSPAAGRHAPVSRAMTSRAAAVASRESSALAARESGRGRPASGRGCCRGLEGPAPAGPAAPGHGRTRRAGRAVTQAPQPDGERRVQSGGGARPDRHGAERASQLYCRLPAGTSRGLGRESTPRDRAPTYAAVAGVGVGTAKGDGTGGGERSAASDTVAAA